MVAGEVKPRLGGLDTLRALAITLVLAFHYQVFVSHEPTFGWFGQLGWVGVDLFFVLSGYLIANQLLGGLAREERLSLRAFYGRRLLRTLPNYYLVLALYLLFPAVMRGGELPPVWKFLTFTQNFELRPGTAFSHAWSLCIEEQFYLVLPLALLLLRGKTRLTWSLLGLAVVSAIVLRSVRWAEYGGPEDGKLYMAKVYYSSLCRADEFLPGVAVAMLKHLHPGWWQRLLAQGRLVFFSGVALLAGLSVLTLTTYELPEGGHGYFMTAFGYSVLAGCFALLVVAALSPVSPLARWHVPGAGALARWSYAIYLSHKALGMALGAALEDRGIAPTSLPAVLLIGFASVATGWLLYRLVESPFLRLRDRLWPSSFAASPQRTNLEVSALRSN